MKTYLYNFTSDVNKIVFQGIVRAETKDSAFDKIYANYKSRITQCKSFEISLEQITEIGAEK